VSTPLLLLPGMDGTGELFGPFVRAVERPCLCARYASDALQSYDELVERIGLNPEVIVVAKSFSGALGLRLAARHPELVRGLLLVASFVTPPPGARLVAALRSLPFRMRPPQAVFRRLLLDGECDAKMVADVSAAISSVEPGVLAHRMALVAQVNEIDRLKKVCNRVATLAISAGADRVLKGKPGVDFESAGVSQVAIDGPHLLLQTRPAQVAKVVQQFCERSRLLWPNSNASAECRPSRWIETRGRCTTCSPFRVGNYRKSRIENVTAPTVKVSAAEKMATLFFLQLIAHHVKCRFWSPHCQPRQVRNYEHQGGHSIDWSQVAKSIPTKPSSSPLTDISQVGPRSACTTRGKEEPLLLFLLQSTVNQ
jgi:pimeloyl-[acyl-carrier protein] methyl ester esterase